MECVRSFKSILLFCFFYFSCTSFNVYPQPDGFSTSRQDQLFKKNNLAFELNFGPAFANRVCIPCYEDKILTGVLFSSSISYLITDLLKVKLEYASFLENWEIFHDDSKPGSYPNNRRDMFVVSASYFPFKTPLWFSGGAGFGNYFFTPRESPMLTQQGTYTYSSIVNTGLIIQGGVGFDYLLWKKLITGIKLIPSYLFLNDLEFVTGESLANSTGSFIIGISVSFGLFINIRQEMSSNR
jgi:hypothetical protein